MFLEEVIMLIRSFPASLIGMTIAFGGATAGSGEDGITVQDSQKRYLARPQSPLIGKEAASIVTTARVVESAREDVVNQCDRILSKLKENGLVDNRKEFEEIATLVGRSQADRVSHVLIKHLEVPATVTDGGPSLTSYPCGYLL